MASLSVDIKNLDIFKDLAEVTQSFVEDERIPKDIREEYKNKIYEIAVKSE